MDQRENCCELMCFGAELMRLWCELNSVRVSVMNVLEVFLEFLCLIFDD
jgi:hypothetical protein